MKYYLGVTDNHWYKFLSKLNPEDVNFWQPSGSFKFKAINSGAPFLFKLKYPINAIGGVGFFTNHSFLPLNIAWDAFGNRNGCLSFFDFKNLILNYRRDKNDLNPTIGCIILTNPIFFDEGDWIETPNDWGKSIVQGKSYNTDDIVGKRLWEKVELLLNKYLQENNEGEKSQLILEEPSSPVYGNSVLTKVRLGQGAFRVLVTDAYNRRCSITGEKTLPVLEAAHIKPYAESGPNFISNGLLLRSDIHKLFDSGYVTVTSDYKIEVSKKIREEFQNGREYYKYHGKELQYLPYRNLDKPNLAFINWHNDNIYKG
jgi:putative restriction endonuclease